MSDQERQQELAALADAVVRELGHTQMTVADFDAIRATILSGDRRAWAETYVSLSYQSGVGPPRPDGSRATEPVYQLGRWGPGQPIPRPGELGPGSRAMQLQQIVERVRDKMEAVAEYGEEVLPAFYPRPVI